MMDDGTLLRPKLPRAPGLAKKAPVPTARLTVTMTEHFKLHLVRFKVRILPAILAYALGLYCSRTGG